MDKDDMVLPEGVDDLSRVEVDEDYPDSIAHYLPPGDFDGPDRSFNPQNGRWYAMVAIPDYDATEYTTTVLMDCAYKGCHGVGKKEVTVSVKGIECDTCGASSVGREQLL